MRGVPIYKDINLANVRFDSMREEIKAKAFTGFIKISYWDMEDYLYFLMGEPVDGIRCFSNGRREKIEVKDYKPVSTTGIFSLYTTSPIEIFAFKEALQDRVTPYTFVGYGQELVAPIQLSHTDPNRVLEDMASMDIYGYMLISKKDNLDYLIVLAKGKPTCVYRSGLYKYAGKEVIEISKEPSYLAVYKTEPEFVNFLASLDTLKKLEDVKLKKLEDAKDVVDKLTEGFKLLEIIISYGLRLFMLLSGKLLIFKVLRGFTDIKTEVKLPNLDAEYSLRIYSIEIKNKLSLVDVVFSSYTETYTDYVPKDVLLSINKAFIEEIGPIGVLVWKKVFEKLGFDLDKLPRSRLMEFIDLLAKEIPDEKHANRFIEKIRRWV